MEDDHLTSDLARQARALFAEALRQVDVRAAVKQHLARGPQALALAGTRIPLAELDRVVIVAVGKASAPMFEAAWEVLSHVPALATEAIVVGPSPPAIGTANVVFVPGAHPTPDERSLQAAAEILALLHTVDARTAVLFLISGGASAMIEQPLDSSISLQDIASFHDALVASGLPIASMNVLRKHLSAVKGGRLAQAAAASRAQATLLVSDVPGASLDAIGSGPSLPDSSMLDECTTLLSLLRRRSPLPPRVERFFAGPLCVETPKPGDPAFRNASWTVILSSDHLARSAADAAQAAGFVTSIDNACDEWDYRDAARHLLDRSAELSARHARTCLISVGEVAVQLPFRSGEGGRNQQFALWSAEEAARRSQPVTVLSAGSDGIDGRSLAAGAVCDPGCISRAAHLGFSASDALARFDAAPLLRALGAQIITGPTGNNLRDLRLLVTGAEPSP